MTSLSSLCRRVTDQGKPLGCLFSECMYNLERFLRKADVNDIAHSLLLLDSVSDEATTEVIFQMNILCCAKAQTLLQYSPGSQELSTLSQHLRGRDRCFVSGQEHAGFVAAKVP